MDIPILINTTECRYCLEETNAEDMVAPCKCTGSSKYVHQQCLKKWFTEKNNRIVIPGNFNQQSFYCEICNTPYKYKINQLEGNDSLLYKDLLIYFSVITSLLFTLYIVCGLLLQTDSNTATLFINFDSYWENVLANGFIMTHIVIGIFYILCGIFLTTRNGGCIFCYAVDIPFDDCSGIYIIVILGIIGTIFIIYYDVISRVVQRHKIRCTEILEILPYSEEES